MRLADGSPLPCTDQPHHTSPLPPSVAAYRAHRCRCQQCRAAVAAAQRHRDQERRAGRPAIVDSGPTLTHIRALRAAGMTLADIAEVAGVANATMRRLPYWRTRVHRLTEQRILAVPVPASSDVDEVAVLRAMGGERLRLTRGEREEAVRRLHTAGLNDLQIGVRLGKAARQVWRDRQTLGLPATGAA